MYQPEQPRGQMASTNCVGLAQQLEGIDGVIGDERVVSLGRDLWQQKYFFSTSLSYSFFPTCCFSLAVMMMMM